MHCRQLLSNSKKENLLIYAWVTIVFKLEKAYRKLFARRLSILLWGRQQNAWWWQTFMRCITLPSTHGMVIWVTVAVGLRGPTPKLFFFCLNYLV